MPAEMDANTRSGADSGPQGRLRRTVCLGVVLWILFAISAVWIRGVQWDENYEYAQAILRQVPYPEAHPFFRYARGAYSIQTYTAAALLWLAPGPAVVCGSRNILFLMATVLPPFLVGALLTRRALWGHVAAVLILAGIHLEFDSTYPQFVWPAMFSNGHVPMGYALAALALLFAGYWRVGYFLIGLMPCIHLGQTPALFLFMLLFSAWAWSSGQRPHLIQAVRWGMAGLALCAALWLLQRPLVPPTPTGGVYSSDIDADAFWKTLTFYHDAHRGVPVTGNSHIALVGMLLMSAAAARLERREKGRWGPWAGWAAYTACVAAVVWPILAAHIAMGPDTPRILVSWLPYRLMLHVPPLVVAGVVAVLSEKGLRTRGRATPLAVLLSACLAYLLIRPVLGHLAGPDLYGRYLGTGAMVFYPLCGAALTGLFLRLQSDRSFATPWAFMCLAGLAGLAAYHQFGAACLICGAAAAFAAKALAKSRLKGMLESKLQGTATAGLCLLMVAALLFGQWRTRGPLPSTPFQRNVAQYLAGRGEADAMLVGPPTAFTLQACTGHPVMTPTTIHEWVGYMPSLAPAIHSIYVDIYGKRYDVPPRPDDRNWLEVWEARPGTEWQSLGDRFLFRYVIAPKPATLDLPVVVDGEHERLYRADGQM